jgi:catalase
LTAARAHQLTADDPDYAIRDLYDAIANGKPPAWKFYIQVMTMAQADACLFNPFDLTKVRQVDENSNRVNIAGVAIH